MNRTKNIETVVSCMKKLIMREEKTVAQAAEIVGKSVVYAYAILKKSYKTETGYNKLLAKSRANAKAQKAKVEAEVPAEIEAKAKAEETKVETQPKVEAPATTKTASQKVIVVEPGYMMAVFNRDGKTALVSFLRDNVGNVYIPEFLLSEMKTMKKKYPLFAELISLCQKWNITSRFLSIAEAREIVYNGYGYKNRSVGIVALARQLRREGKEVELRTSSWEVVELSELQEAGIKTVKSLPIEYEI